MVKDENSCTNWGGPIKTFPSDLDCICYDNHCDIIVDVDYTPDDKEQYEINITFGNVAPADYTFKHTIQLN